MINCNWWNINWNTKNGTTDFYSSIILRVRSSHSMCLSISILAEWRLCSWLWNPISWRISHYFSLYFYTIFKEYHLVDLEFLCELFGKIFNVNVVCYRFELINTYYRNKNILLKSLWWCYDLFSCSLLLVGSWILLALIYPNVICTISV